MTRARRSAAPAPAYLSAASRERPRVSAELIGLLLAALSGSLTTAIVAALLWWWLG